MQLSHLAFLANALAAEHVVRRSVLAVALQQEKRVRYNLEKMRSDSNIVTISVPMISTQQTVDV